MKVELSRIQLSQLHGALHQQCIRVKKFSEEASNINMKKDKREQYLKELVELELYIYSYLFDDEKAIFEYSNHLHNLFLSKYDEEII
jgi:hypothetical protein